MVVNADDPNAEILGGVNLDARRVAFALEPTPIARGVVDVSARLERIDGSGTRMSIHGFNRELSVHLPLVGTRVATCALAAAALAWAMEIEEDNVIAGLESVQTIAGHLESWRKARNLTFASTRRKLPMRSRRRCRASSRRCRTRSSRHEPGRQRTNDGAANLPKSPRTAPMGDLDQSNPRTEDPNQIIATCWLASGTRQGSRGA